MATCCRSPQDAATLLRLHSSDLFSFPRCPTGTGRHLPSESALHPRAEFGLDSPLKRCLLLLSPPPSSQPHHHPQHHVCLFPVRFSTQTVQTTSSSMFDPSRTIGAPFQILILVNQTTEPSIYIIDSIHTRARTSRRPVARRH